VTESEAVPAEQLGADYYQHPLAYFARMREEGPVTPALMPNGDRVWMVTRLEGEVAFGALLARFPGLSLAADPSSLRWRPSSLIHGLEKLPVRLR
jgi:cytochrome P450